MLQKWFKYHHGVGESHQSALYRCLGCRGLITHRIIRRGGCRCGYNRLSPTNPTIRETLKLVVTPWLVK